MPTSLVYPSVLDSLVKVLGSLAVRREQMKIRLGITVPVEREDLPSAPPPGQYPKQRPARSGHGRGRRALAELAILAVVPEHKGWQPELSDAVVDGEAITGECDLRGMRESEWSVSQRGGDVVSMDAQVSHENDVEPKRNGTGVARRPSKCLDELGFDSIPLGDHILGIAISSLEHLTISDLISCGHRRCVAERLEQVEV